MSLQPRDEIVIGGQSTITYLSYTTAILSKEYDETTTATRTSTSQSIEYYPSLTIDLPNPTGTLYVQQMLDFQCLAITVLSHD